MRIEKLDGLRGLFSMMIVILHYREPYLPQEIYDFFIIRESYVFVDFFFVLSGFVIAYNYSSLSNFKGFQIYIKKRFFRLYPLLLYTSLIFLFFDLFSVKFFSQLVEYPVPFSETMLYFFDSILFANSTPLLGITPGINIPSWSISSEMISYILFGLICVFSRNKRMRNILLLFFILISGVLLYITGDFFTEIDYGFLRGIVSFNIGFFVWKFSTKKIIIKEYFESIILISCILVLFTLNILSDNDSLKSIFGLLTVPLFFGLSIFSFLFTNGWISKIFSNNIFQFLGKISYSIYLNHFLLVAVIPVFFFKLIKIEQNSISELIIFTITITITITYSYFTHKYIEIAGGKLLKNIFNKKK